jgi:quercetin dioxygenase-like cupin family protein
MPQQRTAHLSLPSPSEYRDWMGKPLRILAETQHTAGHYAIQQAIVPKGSGPVTGHRHWFGESFYLLSGSAEFTAGNCITNLCAGDFIHIAGGTAHRFVTHEETELLTLVAPAGFDVFQRRVLRELSMHSQPVGPAEFLKVGEKLGTQFGIDLHPPAEAWTCEPNIQVVRAHEGPRVAAVGDIYRFLAESEHTGGDYAIWHGLIGPQGGPPPHIHRREEEGFYVLKGELTFYSQGQSFVGGPGTFVNLPRDVDHYFRNLKDEPAEVLVMVAPAGLEKMFRNTGKPIGPEVTLPIPPQPDELARLKSFVADYGISLLPADSQSHPH